MGYREYQKFLTKVKNKMSPYLNGLGLYYNKEIQKFVGFNDYEIVLIEFEEFLTDTQLAINFKRYTNILDEEYHFALPKKNLYGCRDISFSHWKYYPERVDKKDKEQLNVQLEMMTDEMLAQIKLKFEPLILTEYPIDVYIEEKYLKTVDDLAMKNHPLGYTFYDEWIIANEERVNTMPWWSNLCNELYAYELKKREVLLPYKDYYTKMMKKYEINKIVHQKEAKNYLSRFHQGKFIEPTYKYYTIKEVMDGEFGQYVEHSLQKHGFIRQESIGCHRNSNEAFYSKEINIEVYLSIYNGIRWTFSYSTPNEYGMLTVKDIQADCDGLCLIDDINYKEKIDQAIEKLLISLEV